MKLADIKEARQHFPLAPRRQAVRQAIKLTLAKDYLKAKNINAMAIGNAFQYVRATGSIL
jgi:shikimate kinase